MVRFRTRLAVTACSALLLLASAATPTLAGPGGNAANAAVCAKGGYRYLVDASGNDFANAGQCARHVARSGAMITLTDNAVRDSGFGPSNDFTVSGSGFTPNTALSIRFETDAGVVETPPDSYTTDGFGNFANPFSWACNIGVGTLNYITVSDGVNTAYTTQDILCQ